MCNLNRLLNNFRTIVQLPVQLPDIHFSPHFFLMISERVISPHLRRTHFLNIFYVSDMQLAFSYFFNCSTSITIFWWGTFKLIKRSKMMEKSKSKALICLQIYPVTLCLKFLYPSECLQVLIISTHLLDVFV